MSNGQCSAALPAEFGEQMAAPTRHAAAAAAAACAMPR